MKSDHVNFKNPLKCFPLDQSRHCQRWGGFLPLTLCCRGKVVIGDHHVCAKKTIKLDFVGEVKALTRFPAEGSWMVLRHLSPWDLSFAANHKGASAAWAGVLMACHITRETINASAHITVSQCCAALEHRFLGLELPSLKLWMLYSYSLERCKCAQLMLSKWKS